MKESPCAYEQVPETVKDANLSIAVSANSQPLVLAIDIGSSSSRAALFDCHGQRIPNSLIHATYDGSTIESRYGALNPEPLAGAVEGLIDRLLDKLDTGVEIGAVATSTFWHSIMGIDDNGRPSTAVLMWSDIRSAEDCAILASKLDADAYYQRTGTPIHSSYPPAKLLWLQRERPDAFGRTTRWMSFGEYLYQRFFGHASISISMASATGLFNQERLDWDIDCPRRNQRPAAVSLHDQRR